MRFNVSHTSNDATEKAVVPSRRSMLRGAAAAAWAVPAISIATAAPAFAVSSGLAQETTSGISESGNRVILTLNLANPNGTIPAATQALLEIPAGAFLDHKGAPFLPKVTLAGPSGTVWNAATWSEPLSSGARTVLFTLASPYTPTGPFSLTFTLNMNSGNNTFRLTAATVMMTVPGSGSSTFVVTT